MLEKTRGIILHHLKYDDTAIIVRVYTEHSGLISFLTRSYTGKKARFPSSFLRPMTAVRLVLSIKPHGELHSVREASLLSSPRPTVMVDAVACFIAEVLLRTQTNPQPDNAIFDYLLAVCQTLSDTDDDTLKAAPADFLLRYARLMGFAVQDERTFADATPARRLNALLNYYATQLERPLTLKSLPVLHELFH